MQERTHTKGPKGTLKLPGSLRRAHLDRSPRYAEGQLGGCSLEGHLGGMPKVRWAWGSGEALNGC